MCRCVCMCLWVGGNSTTRNITQTLPTLLLVKSQCFSSASAWLHYFDFSDYSMSFQKDALLWWDSIVATAKVKPPRAPSLQGTIYLSILYPPWLPGQKGQCHKPLWQYAVVLWTDLDRGCWDGHKMPTGWTFALQPCKMILFLDVWHVCQDQVELSGNYDRLCISCNYILISAFVTAIVVNVVVVVVVIDVLVFVTILWLLCLYCYLLILLVPL